MWVFYASLDVRNTVIDSVTVTGFDVANVAVATKVLLDTYHKTLWTCSP